jgi:hypothetical protein
MKTKQGLLFGFAVFLMAAMFSLAGCSTDSTEGWDVHISDVQQGQAITSAVIPASPGSKSLYAITTGAFNGTLNPLTDITYQWKKDGSPVGTSGYSPSLQVSTAGSYTVEVTARDNGTKTSAAVTVTGP